MTAYSEQPAPYGESVVRYGGFWIRFVAFVLDGILLSIVGSLVNYLIALVADALGADPFTVTVFSGLVGLVIGATYYILMESSERQATIGKMALSLKVTDMQGQRISAGTAAVRYFSKFLSALILLIGYIMAAFHPRKQALHDLIAKTLVVRQTPAPPPVV